MESAPTEVRAIRRSARNWEFGSDLANLEEYMTDLARKRLSGVIAQDQYRQQVAEINFGTSTTGRPTQALIDRTWRGDDK